MESCNTIEFFLGEYLVYHGYMAKEKLANPAIKEREMAYQRFCVDEIKVIF